MQLLLRSAKIIDPNSKHNGQQADVLVVDGKIAKIGRDLDAPDAREIKTEGLHVSPGWLDLRANFRDPGEEYKEDLKSGLMAAARGGFTGVALMPSTVPAIDSKADVEYLLARSNGQAVEVFPVGALSKGLNGESLSEMYDMAKAGARAFTDDKKTVRESGLLLRALHYAHNFDGVIMHFPLDDTLVKEGQVNEGQASILTGLKAIPHLSEELMINRDLRLLDYSQGRLHLGPISTASGVELIRQAKKDGLKLTAEVSAQQLFFTEDDVTGFDTNLKLLPPLRTMEDRKAILEGLADGTIDAISSDHSPEDVENKKLEFDFAAFGMSSIEFAFSAALTATSDNLSLEQLITRFTSGPRNILGLENPTIEEGSEANLTFFTVDEEWKPKPEDSVSKSKFSGYFGKKLKGKVLGVVNQGSFGG